MPFAYVELLKISSSAKEATDACINMHIFICDFNSDGTHKGLIIPLTDIWLPVEVVPVFGKRCNQEWTKDSAVELAKELRLNVFDRKTTYMLVY